MGFCREECIEEPVDFSRFDARATVGNVDQDTLATHEPRTHLQHADAIGKGLIASTAFVIKFSMTCCN